MELHEIFSAEWDALKRRHQELLGEIMKIEKERVVLFETDENQKILREKNRLKKDVRDLQSKLNHEKREIEGYGFITRKRKEALIDKQLHEQIEGGIEKITRRLRMVNTSQAETGELKKALWWAKSPIEDIEQEYLLQHATVKRNEEMLKRELESNLGRIQDIDDYCHRLKKWYAQMIINTQDEKEQHLKKMTEWAGQDIDHLRWIAKHDPHHLSNALYFFRSKFPLADLTEFFPRDTSSKTHAEKSKKRNSSLTPKTEEKIIAENPLPWEFFIAKNKDDPGERISSKRQKFLKKIQDYVHCSTRGLKPNLVYKKLIEPLTKGVSPRQLNITQIIEAELHGWWRLPIEGYRIPLFINESLHQIRFFICKKGDEPY